MNAYQHICCDCKKCFCSLCSLLLENLRICTTCNLLKATAFQRPQLMRLRVKDLRQYLLLRNIPTDTCREKEDLVDLVLGHRGSEGEDVRQEEDDDDYDDRDTASLNPHPLYTPPALVEQSASEVSALGTLPHEEPLARSDSSDSNQVSSSATD